MGSNPNYLLKSFLLYIDYHWTIYSQNSSMCNARTDYILLPQFRDARSGGTRGRTPQILWDKLPYLNHWGDYNPLPPPDFQNFRHPCSSSKFELHAKPVSLLITINSSLAFGCGACVLLRLCFGCFKTSLFPHRSSTVTIKQEGRKMSILSSFVKIW